MASLTVICPNKARCVVKVTPSKSLHEVLEEACKKQGYDTDIYALKHQNRLLDLSLSFRLSGLTNNASVELVPAPISGPVQVEIALQLADGSRHLRKFTNDVTLLQLLTAFSEDFQQNLADTAPNTVPSCGYMNKQWTGKSELEITTLKSLGIKQGRSLIRYAAKQTTDEEMAELEQRLIEERQRQEKLDAVFERKRQENQQREQLEQQREAEYQRELAAEAERRAQLAASPLEEDQHSTAMDISDASTVTASNPLREEGGGSSRLSRLEALLGEVTRSIDSNAADFLPDRIMTERGTVDLNAVQRNSARTEQHSSYPPNEFANFKFPDKVESSDDASGPAQQQSRAIPSCDRRAVVFVPSEPEHQKEASASGDEIPDEFFDVTTSDLRSMQRILADDAKSVAQRAFVPKGFVEAKDAERKRAAWKHTVVRFLLPDQRTMQACFISIEPVSRLFEFTKSALADSKLQFSLSLPPNIRVINEEKSLIDASLAPTVTLVVKLQSDGKLNGALLNDSISQVDAHKAAQIGKDWLGANERFVPFRPTVPEELSTVANASRRLDYGNENAGATSSSSRSAPPNLPKWLKK